MRIKSEQFCAIATSPSWQAWLYNYNSALYKQFIDKLTTSTGCTKNREIMLSTLDQIGLMGGTDSLAELLMKNYPHVIDNSAQSATVSAFGSPAVSLFSGYKPGILTYPRRVILTGGDVAAKANEFVADKLRSDVIVLDGKAYVEYLTVDDKDILNSIPAKNWQIAAYRARQNG